MTPAEQAYFQSGGANTEALEKEWAETSQGETVASENAGPAPDSPQQEAPASGDPDEDGEIDGEITIDGNGKNRDAKGRFIPHQAHHALREKYKATRTELEAAKTQMARFDERMAVLNEFLGNGTERPTQQQKSTPDEKPDPEKDIFAYVRWQEKELESLKSQLNEKTSRYDAHHEEQQFRSTYIADATKFLGEKPDFRDAYVHLVTGRDRELAALGMTDDAARKAHIAKEEKALVQQALTKGMSPSKVLYDFAIARGYSAAAAQQAANPAAKIENIQRGQKTAGVSLSGAGGTSGEGLTAEALSNMNEDEFAAVMSKLSAAQRRQLLGG